jgi:hypothetical protein
MPRKRSFDFDEDDDDIALDDAFEGVSSSALPETAVDSCRRTHALPSQRNTHLPIGSVPSGARAPGGSGRPTQATTSVPQEGDAASSPESSLTPFSQKSRPASSARAARPLAASAGDAAHGNATGSPGGMVACPASIVDRIWAAAERGADSSRGEGDHRIQSECKEVPPQPGPGGESLIRSVGQERAGSRPGAHLQQRVPASQLQQEGTPRSSIDRIWNASLTSTRSSGGSTSSGALHSQSASMQNDLHEGRLRASRNEEMRQVHSQEPALTRGAGARDVWKERGRQSGRFVQEDSWTAESADDYTRQVLLSAPRPSQARAAASQGDATFDDFEVEGPAGGWGPESARARGGRGIGEADLGGPKAAWDSRRLRELEPRPSVPGPAGKLGRSEAGPSNNDGRASPALRESGEAAREGAREMREGIAFDATGPHLPLRKSFLVRGRRCCGGDAARGNIWHVRRRCGSWQGSASAMCAPRSRSATAHAKCCHVPQRPEAEACCHVCDVCTICVLRRCNSRRCNSRSFSHPDCRSRSGFRV